MVFGISGNPTKLEIVSTVLKITQYLRKQKVPFVLHKTLSEVLKGHFKKDGNKVSYVSDRQLGSMCDMIIALGGDGTILRLARLVRRTQTPILGINLGKLGFLAEVSQHEIGTVLKHLLRGEYNIEERTMLQVASGQGKNKMYCLNDIVVSKYNSQRVIDIEIFLNNEPLTTFTADGVIVATPTGSTAYALATGGPIVTPSNPSILLCPLSPHSLTARTLVVSDNDEIKIGVSTHDRYLHVVADGQVSKVFPTPASVTITKSAHVTKLIKIRGKSYYSLLKRKLQWATDPRFEARHS